MDIIRKDTAKQYKYIRRILRNNTYEPDMPRKWHLNGLYWAIAALLLGTMVLCVGCAQAEGIWYSNIQYVNAIYLSEGGIHAKYAYGIRSVHYATIEEAKSICFRTVRNNLKRYKKYGYKHYASYLQFLGSVYCPVSGKNQTVSEKRLNGNWIHNTQWYLEHPKKG